MRLTLARSGGFAGLRTEVSVDTEKLSSEEAEEIASLVEHARIDELASRSPLRGRGADRFQYDLTLEEDGGERTLSVAEDAAPPELRALIERLLSGAGPPRAPTRPARSVPRWSAS